MSSQSCCAVHSGIRSQYRFRNTDTVDPCCLRSKESLPRGSGGSADICCCLTDQPRRAQLHPLAATGRRRLVGASHAAPLHHQRRFYCFCDASLCRGATPSLRQDRLALGRADGGSCVTPARLIQEINMEERELQCNKPHWRIWARMFLHDDVPRHPRAAVALARGYATLVRGSLRLK